MDDNAFEYTMPQCLADCAEEIAGVIGGRYDARFTPKRRMAVEDYLGERLAVVARDSDARYADTLGVPQRKMET